MNCVTLEIGRQITKYRNIYDLNKKELSEIIGVAPSTVSGWENGDYAPSADTLVKLCDYFKITLDEIYGLTKNAPGISPEGKYANIIRKLDKLMPDQVFRVEGFIECMLMDNAAAEAAKQISHHSA